MLEHPGIVKVLLFYFYFLLLLKFLNVQLGGRQHLHTENDPFYIVVGEWGGLTATLKCWRPDCGIHCKILCFTIGFGFEVYP
jgi:hypothetical protein